MQRLKVHVDTNEAECQTILGETYFKDRMNTRAKSRGDSNAGSGSRNNASSRSSNLINKAKADSKDRESGTTS